MPAAPASGPEQGGPTGAESGQDSVDASADAVSSSPAPAPAPPALPPLSPGRPPGCSAVAGPGSPVQETAAGAQFLESEVSPAELSKWTEMIGQGIRKYMTSHPDRFYRRVRRGIPQRFRWQVWKAKVGVEGSELTSRYATLCNAPTLWTAQIEIDIGRTFPELRSFNGDKQQKLLRVLNAYAAHNPDVGYCQGMNFVAGLLLIVSDMREEESFAVLAQLMDDPDFGLSGFYRERLPLLRRYLRACDRLVQDTVPELRDHFIKESVQPAVYLHQWFLTLFINCFPLSMVLVIWDVVICEGLPVILRIAVSILQVLKDSLLTMHFEEIIKFFKMMKTYDDEDGELNAFRIGQLLMKHTEHVQIPERTMEYLAQNFVDDDGNLDSDESWEADISSGSWLQSVARMLFSSAKRRATGAGTGASPGAASGASRPSSSALGGSSGAAFGGAGGAGGGASAAGAAAEAADGAAAGPLHSGGRRGACGHLLDSRLPQRTGAAGAAGGDAGGMSAEDDSVAREWEFV